MKLVIKIALFVCFLYNIGLYDALLVSNDSSEQVDEATLRSHINSVNPEQFVTSAMGNVNFADKLNRARYDEFTNSFKNQTVITVLSSVFHQYLINMPLAFILFLLWLYQDKKKLKTPFSFVLSLLMYPFIIAKLIYSWAKIVDNSIDRFRKKVVLETELRRTKDKFFSMLSDDEIIIIRKAITDKLSRKDFQTSLKAQGFIFQRSFALALLATVIFTALPLKANNDQDISHSTEITILIDIHQLDDDVGWGSVNTDIDLPSFDSIPELILISFIYLKSVCYKFIFYDRIEKIPLCVQLAS